MDVRLFLLVPRGSPARRSCHFERSPFCASGAKLHPFFSRQPGFGFMLEAGSARKKAAPDCSVARPIVLSDYSTHTDLQQFCRIDGTLSSGFAFFRQKCQVDSLAAQLADLFKRRRQSFGVRHRLNKLIGRQHLRGV